MAREYTTDEVREMFMNHIRGLISYWDDVLDRTPREKLSGLAHSILVTLDGGSIAVPGFIVAPCPHESDRQHHSDQDENWFPENHENEDKINGDIAGNLHALLYKTS